jgi:anti-anti-sigma factor
MLRPEETRTSVAPQAGAEGPVCTITIQRHLEWTAVILRGELDLNSAGELAGAVKSELVEGRPVIVELVGLEFSDVEGVRALAQLVSEGERCAGGAGVELHGARGQVDRLFRALGHEQLLPETGS